MADFPNRRLSGPTAVAAGISLLIFFYAAIRAATLSITIDEAFTYSWHVTGGWSDIVLFRTPGLPDNNHVLYTLLAKLSLLLFGVSELTLRLPSLLGCLSYLIGINLCLKRITPGWTQVFGLLVTAMNPYVLDFLGLARGYGLGLGFTMLGLAALLAALEAFPEKIRSIPLQWAFGLFALAVLSHLSFLLVFGAALLIIVAALISSAMIHRHDGLASRPPWGLLVKIISTTLLLLGYLSIPVHIIHQRKLFNQGGHRGFWADTVGSLLQGTIYDTPLLTGQNRLLELWIILTVLALPFALWALRRADRKKCQALIIIVTLTGIVSVESLLEHLLFNVAWLQGRRGIFLIPLFLLSALALGRLPRTASHWLAALGRLAGVFVPAVLVVNGFMSMNLYHTYDWKNCAGTREAMLVIRERIAMHKSSEPLYMRSHWILEYGVNFYRHTLGLETSLINTDGFDGPADFYYGYTEDEQAIKRFGVRLLLKQPLSNTVLFEQEEAPSRAENPGTVP